MSCALIERGNQTHTLRAVARLLPPARFAPRTPAVRAGFMVIHPGLIQIDNLLGGPPRPLRPKLLPQRFVPLGLGKGLFFCG